MNHELQQEGHFAGRHSDNNSSKLHYGYPSQDQPPEYLQQQEASSDRMENRRLIFESQRASPEQEQSQTKHRQYSQRQDQPAKGQPPKLSNAVFFNNQYHNDKQDIKEILGSSPDAYRRYKRCEAANPMNVSKINRARHPLYWNRPPNMQDLMTDSSEGMRQKEVVPKHRRDPLNPVYKIESPSRQAMKDYGQIEGSSPVQKTLPKTRHRVNQTKDIQGASPKDRGTVPSGVKLKLSSNDQLVRMPSETMRNMNQSKDNGAIFIQDEGTSPKSIAPFNNHRTLDLSIQKSNTVDRAVGTSRRKSYLAYTGQQSLQQYHGPRILENNGLNEYVAQAKRNLNMSSILDPRYSKSNSRERPTVSRRFDFGARSVAPASQMNMYASANHDNRSVSNGSRGQAVSYPANHFIQPIPLVLESSVDRQKRNNPNIQKSAFNPITHTPPPFKQGASLPFSPTAAASSGAF